MKNADGCGRAWLHGIGVAAFVAGLVVVGAVHTLQANAAALVESDWRLLSAANSGIDGVICITQGHVSAEGCLLGEPLLGADGAIGGRIAVNGHLVSDAAGLRAACGAGVNRVALITSISP